MSEVDIYQEAVAAKLRLVFNQSEVDTRWKAFAGQGRRIYQPEVDIAVGPFAVESARYEEDYDIMVQNNRNLIDEWISRFSENWQVVIGQRYWAVPPDSPSSYQNFTGYGSNRNARCFIAIEVENETSRKHLMGSIVNSGALGRIGILVAWQDKVLRAAIRMREYFDYLQRAEKRTFNMSGVIIMTSDQLATTLGIQ